MSKRLFSNERISELELNPNVTKCSDKSITYAGHFKVLAVDQFKNGGIAPHTIFYNNGFSESDVSKRRAAWLVRDWTIKYQSKGIESLITETRGRKSSSFTGKKPKDHTSKEYVEWLEAEVAFLRFLRYGTTE
jgi:transposase